MNQMLVLSDEKFKTTIIQMLQQTIMNSLETSEKIENVNIEIEAVKKN